MNLEFSLAAAVNVAIGAIVGSIATALVAWYYFRRTTEETTNLLRTFARFLEQLAVSQGVEVSFHRDAEGEIDLTRQGVVLTVRVPEEQAIARDRFEAEIRHQEDAEGNVE